MKPRRARGALVVPGEVVAIRSFMRTRLLPDRHAGNLCAQGHSGEIMRASPRCDQGIAFEESMPIRGQAKSSGHRSLSLLVLHSRIGPMNSRRK